MIRILHLTRDFPPRHNGGLSTAVSGLVRATTSAELSHAVVSFDGYRPRRGAPARSTEGTLDTGGPLLRIEAGEADEEVAAFVLRVEPHVVHVHDALLWALAERLAVRACRIYTVHVAQGFVRRLRGVAVPSLSEQAEERALVAADHVTVPSRAAERVIREQARSRVCRLGFGVDDCAEARRVAGSQREGAAVLYVGRLADVKGTAEVWRAMPRVRAVRPDAHWCVAGGLVDNARAERRWRRRLVECLGGAGGELPAGVELTGWLTPRALAHRYEGASVLCAPSWFETFGLAVLEAQLHGLPVVAARGSALEERIEHGTTGLIVPPRDEPALTAALLELLDDPARARAMGAAGARAARASGLWSHVAAGWHRLYATA